ncbi:MAG: GNAT family N-acetyltransferase [Anaerolineae bacterium]|nr:GNAT family N-acetyltransferase [Anaerolineae bacterium]
MSDVTIRPARESDQEMIKQMVRDEQLDPTNLNWPQFVVAEHDGQIVGIGQVRPYPKCRELGSIVVKAEYRKKGVGALIINTLLANETGVVYLESEAHNERYYARFGFERIPFWRAPMPLKAKAGMIKMMGLFMGFRMVVMRRPAPGG